MACSLFVINASAQEEGINQEVRVVREYSPTVSDAFKINRMPQPADDELASPSFDYRLTGKAIVGAPEVVPLIPARMSKEPREDLNSSYLQGYVGNYNTIGAALKYNILQNEKYALALKAAHESSLGEVEVTGIDEDAQYHESLAGLYMRHFFKQKTLSLDIDFSNLAYRYYGASTINPELDYVNRYPENELGVPEPVPGSSLIPEAKQHQSAIDVIMGLKNQQLGFDNTRWDLLMGYSSFGSKTGIRENQFKYKGDFDFSLGELGLRFETALNHAGTNTLLSDSPFLYNFEKRQQTLVSVNPGLTRNTDKMQLKFGLRISAEFDDLEDNLYVSPDLTVKYTVVEGVLAIDGGITGEIMPSTYRSIMEENPYVAPDVNVKTAFHGVRFFFGTKGNFSQATSFAAKVEYSVFSDEHFFVNRQFNQFGMLLQTDYSNQFDVVYDDGNLLTVSGEFNVKFSPDLNMTLRGKYYGWRTDSLSQAWHKPEMEVGARFAYRANESLSLYGAVNLLGSRYVSLPAAAESLDPVYDFNVGANYNLNRRWNFFGEIRNLIASKYNRWYGYPGHGINAIVGLGYSF